MKLEFIDLGKLSISKANMRYAKKAPDVSDILPTVRKRGVLQTLIVRPCGDDGEHEILAGSRRFTAASIVAEETGRPEPLPCAILEAGDDAAAVEASLIENFARRDADEVTQWVSFARLVREGRNIAEISETFGLPELGVKRILALGNLLPRIRSLYQQEEVNYNTIRQLTLATKSQQRAWLALFDENKHRCPTGQQLKAWLFGGGAIKVQHALFDVEASKLTIVADLFGEDRYFADSDAFWSAQEAMIDARREAYLDEGWSDVVIVGPNEYFHGYEYRKATKRKGGRIYVDVRDTGEVVFHEGYLTAKEAAKLDRGEAIDTAPKAARPELTARMQTYNDLHRHAAVRAELVSQPSVALRMMVAHAIKGSSLWRVEVEPQTAKDEDVRESVETSLAETMFDTKRRAVLALLGFSPEEPTVTGGGEDGTALLFQRLILLPDSDVMDILGVVMGETLAAGGRAVEALGAQLGVDMAAWWTADDAFFEGLRDKEVLGAIVAEVAGPEVALANGKEKGATLKAIVRSHLDGTGGRTKVEGWVPKWMRFPPAAYTARGGVGSVAAHTAISKPEAVPEPVAEAA